MEWICSLIFMCAMLLIWFFVRSCYKTEDRLVYLNTYEFIETLQEPARSHYLTYSLKYLDQFFSMLLLSPLLGTLLIKFTTVSVTITILLLYLLFSIGRYFLQDRKLSKDVKHK